MEDSPILYVVLNKELKMSAGKAAAQTAHAVMLLGEHHNDFTDSFKRTVIVLEAKNQAQIENLWEYLTSADIYSNYYIDEGHNEVAPYSITALAVEPIAAYDEAKREIFAPFSLFSAYTPDVVIKRDNQIAIDSINHVMPFQSHMPRYVKKTLKWLEER